MLLIRQTFSQRTWPDAGDVDDCWVVSTIQCVNAVAPWIPLLTVREFRAAAGDPDDGNADGGNVADIMRGIRVAYPSIADLCVPMEGATWVDVLASVKVGRPASVAVVSSRLPIPYGFTGLHQVTYFHEPTVGLRIANPLAPDRSEPTRIPTASAQRAAEAFGGGRVHCVLFPTVAAAYERHPLYTPADCTAAVAAATAPYEARITAIRAETARHAATVAGI